MRLSEGSLPGPSYPAPGKLNLFLHVVGRRADGYHLLQTIFRFVEGGDMLRFRVRRDGVIRRTKPIPGVEPEADLALRAARVLQQEAGSSLGADIELAKRLPIGGGMGGGSSDAATTLLVLNRLWQTGLTRERLMKVGLSLGADVPVFIYGRSCFAEGIGDRFQAIELPPAWYVILAPRAAVSTREIFAAAKLTQVAKPIKLAAFSAASGLFERLVETGNDLEAAAVKRYPEIGRHLAWLRQFGAARMTGSGSSVFCPFTSRPAAENALRSLPQGMQGWIAAGVDRHPLYQLAEDN
ncbi:MAG: 4-(cytidine 5'-diphospho)-2-C-methyl-D-erythritol kinase [Burkholderiales bacterium]|nr:4-(cytidine 5'-diphospho)-2-C-methyl-D-erythritol kinase [Burkholderiales bacterium]